MYYKHSYLSLSQVEQHFAEGDFIDTNTNLFTDEQLEQLFQNILCRMPMNFFGAVTIGNQVQFSSGKLRQVVCFLRDKANMPAYSVDRKVFISTHFPIIDIPFDSFSNPGIELSVIQRYLQLYY